MRPTTARVSVVALVLGLACSDDSIVEPAVLPPIAAAPAPTKYASLADGMVASPQPVKVSDNDDFLRLDNAQVFQASINLDQTFAAGIEDCVPGPDGADAATMTALLQKLMDPPRGRRKFQSLTNRPLPSSTGNWIVMGWDEPDGQSYFLKLGVTEAGPSSSPTVTLSDNVYSYTGGTVFILRDNGLKGKAQVKRGMICPNRDRVDITFPVGP